MYRHAPPTEANYAAAAGGTAPGAAAHIGPADELLQRRVEELPLELQTVIRLRFYEELSLREISEATGWNLNTVKTRLYTALKKLRVSLEGDELYG